MSQKAELIQAVKQASEANPGKEIVVEMVVAFSIPFKTPEEFSQFVYGLKSGKVGQANIRIVEPNVVEDGVTIYE
jgi:hypothetical protein